MLGVLVPETMQMKKTKSNHRRLEARRRERQKMRFAFFAVFAVAASAMVMAVHADDWYAGADLDASGDADTFRYCGDGVLYEYDTHKGLRTLTIKWDQIGTGSMTDYVAGEPPWLDAIPARTVLEVTILEGVKKIGAHAFDRLYNNEEIRILSDLTGVKWIGDSAFQQCTFTGCPDLSDVITIGRSAFDGCKGIDHLDLTNATSIGSSAFAGCNEITTVIFGSNLAEIASDAFQGITFYENETTELELSAANMKGHTFVMIDGKLVKQTLQILVFDYGYGAPVVRIYHNGDTIVKPADPEKTGYTFKYWTEDHSTEFADTTMPSRSMILTPFWAVNQYEVVIDDPGHLTVMDDETVVRNGDKVDYGTLLTVKAAERAGYTSKVLLNGTEVSEGYFKVGLENVLDVEYKADPAVIDDDDDSNYQPYPVTDNSSSSDSEKVVVMAVAAVAGLVAVLGALVAFKF